MLRDGRRRSWFAWPLARARARLIRQLLTESGVLAAASGAASLLAASWGSRVLSQLLARGGPNPIPFDVDVRPNFAVLGYTVLACAATTIGFALVPAMQSTRVELTSAIKQGRGVAGGGRRVGRLLVVGQLALVVPLLIAAGVFVRGLRHLETLDVGFARDNLLVVQADLPRDTGELVGVFPEISRTMERLRSIPGVLAVTVSENGLFGATDSNTQALRVEGIQSSRKEDSAASFDQVGAGYFRAIGIPLVAGREFDARDTADAPRVAVVNDTIARFYFGQQSALGKVIWNGGDRYTIVGVVRDSRQRDLKASTTERRFYIPLLQTSDHITSLNFVVQTRGVASSAIPEVRRELRGMGSAWNAAMVESARTLMRESLSGERSIARLASLFALLALTLAAVGLYGVIAYATARRTNEIGVRMALGASRGLVTRMVLREALMLTAAGLAVGLPLALIVLRVTAARIAGVGGPDAVAFIGATAVMLVVAVVAAGVPALRASRIDPAVALREE